MNWKERNDSSPSNSFLLFIPWYFLSHTFVKAAAGFDVRLLFVCIGGGSCSSIDVRHFHLLRNIPQDNNSMDHRSGLSFCRTVCGGSSTVPRLFRF